MRRGLYSNLYDQLFERVPDHPQLTRRADAADQAAYAEDQVELIRQFLPPGGSYVEIGAGDCATVRRVAEFAGRATAVEVSAEIVPDDVPEAVGVAISDGVSIPVAPGSADVVYSNQVMEHLHPDDAAEQLRNIAVALRPGGRYLCITPNRLSGPHDISYGFDAEARGFHLREYTYRELARLFKASGFRRVRVFERAGGRALTRLAALAGRVSPALGRRLAGSGNRALVLPLAPYLAVEAIARVWPRHASGVRVLRRLLTIKIVAER